MSKYLPGAYLLIAFDAVGTRLWSRAVTGLLDGQARGADAAAAGECDSFAVVRVISNSRFLAPERYEPRDRRNDHGFR